MAELSFSLLDHTDSGAVAQYERSLFRAFYPHYNQMFPLIWRIDRKERRLCSCIPYSDQDIIVGRLNGTIIAGAAINYAVHKRMQAEMLGFSIDKSQTGICEGRALFSLQILAGGVSVLANMGEFAYTYLDRRHIEKVYGTCSPKMLRGYRSLGFNVIGEGVVAQQRLYLLEKLVESPFPK